MATRILATMQSRDSSRLPLLALSREGQARTTPQKESEAMKRVKTYRNYVIWKDSNDNYRVEQPSGFFFDEPATNLKTAKKWIDCAVFELNN